jgi:hypothetical protein
MAGCEKITDGEKCGGALAFTGWDIRTERAVLKCDSCGRVTLGEKRKIVKRRYQGTRGRSSRR